MVNCNSFISFMASSVHISIKYEINISFISYSDDLDVMLSSGIAEISVLQFSETENLIYLFIAR